MTGRLSPVSIKNETNHKCHKIWASLCSIHYVFPKWKV